MCQYLSPNLPNLNGLCILEDQNLLNKLLITYTNHIMHRLLPPVSNILRSCSLIPYVHHRVLPNRFRIYLTATVLFIYWFIKYQPLK